MSRARLILPLVLCVFCLDCTTKELAALHLEPANIPHPFAGDVVRFTLAYNQGAAMSLPVGDNPRWPLAALATLAVLAIGRWITQTPATLRLRLVALGLVMAGALGNLVDRLRSERGVVDFIDVGIGAWRFWTFNIADVAITAGALLLATQLWRGAQDSGHPGEAAAP